MQKLLLSLTLLSAALLLPPSSRAQFIVVGQPCGAGGLTGIANDGTPVVCRTNPPTSTSLVWVAVGGSSSTSSAVSGQFNVKTYGAIGDTKFSRNCTTANSTTVTNTDAPWTATDVGKLFESINTAQGSDVFTPARKITGFSSSSSITIDALPDGTGTPGSAQYCKWFTADDTAAFQAAVTAAKTNLAAQANDPRINSPTLAYPGTVFCPPGGYTVSGTIFLDAKGTGSNSTLGIGFLGAGGGGGQCIIYPTATFNGTVEPLCTGTKAGLINTCQTVRTDIENINVEGSDILIPTSGIATGQGWILIDKCNNCTIKNNTVTDIGLAQGGTNILYLFGTSGIVENNFIQNSPVGDQATACLISSSVSLRFANNTCSNHGISSLVISGSGSRGSGSGQLLLENNLIDECTGGGQPCTAINTSSVVNYVGGVTFGGAPEIMSIDGTSSVYMTDHNLQQFGSGSGAVPGVTIASGGLLEASQSTLVSNGAAVIVSAPVGATYVDVGGNTYLNCLSGTCNKVTATDYSTHGFSGGIVPKSTQTHTPNTCYAVTGNLLATAQNICIVLLDQNYQLLNMTAQSGGTTPANSSCATPPVITLSDGTRSATMTMTTGKTQWLSNVDAVTNINQVFASGATLTVSIGANTCATPPTNVSVNFDIQSAVNP